MTMSSFPGGFKDGVLIRGIPLSVTHPGKVFWVGNASAAALPGHKSASDGNPGTFNAPFSTIDYAIGQCTASRGDIIMVKPGHTEAITAAAGVVADIAGVAIVGLGTGSLRPKITFGTAAGADMDITAANCSFVNLNFQATFADITAAIDISGVAGLSFANCYFTESAADLNFVDVIDVATGASDMSFENCKFITSDAANDSHITGVAIDGLYISNCYFAANTAQTAVVGLIETSGNATNVVIKDSHFRSNVDGALFLDFNGTANSGLVSNCYFSSIDTAGAVTAGFDFTGGHMFECYVAGEDDSFGLIGGGTVYNNA
jgi:hypothetical protein